MKSKCPLLLGAALCSLLTAVNPAFAQGTAFTYQGRLFSGTNAANGSYDLTFALYNASSGPSQVGNTVTNLGVGVSNGLFTVAVDFGAGVFNGTAYWLQIAVRTNSVGSFTNLSPRQQLTPTPYAIFAEGGNAAGLTGTIPGGNLGGTYGNPITLNNPANSFTGNGSGLFGVNAATLGGLDAAQFWQLGGNAGTTPGVNFLGTPDNTALEFKVNNVRGLRIEPDSIFNTPNVIGGSSANYISPGSVGNFIGAGGQPGYFEGTNSILGSGNVNVIGGGWNNTISNAYEGTILGGYFNSVGNNHATVGGGEYNTAGGVASTVPGGGSNVAAGDYSFAAGQNAKANHEGAFVWADSSGGDFASTTNNQFLVRADFMGLNRATRVTAAEYFGILAPITNTWGGMYIQTLATGRPFYGYYNPGGASWTEMDGTDGNKWKLYNGGYWLTVTPSGNVGIRTTSPASPLHVAGDTRIEGVTQIGSGTGNAETPDKGLIIRRAVTTTTSAGSVVARTDTLTLERDGTYGGWRISNVAGPGNTTIAATGLTSAGATVNFVTSIPSAAAAGTTIVFTDAQSVVSFRCSFGNSFDPDQMTEVSLTRYPTDWFWTGTLTSTFNQ